MRITQEQYAEARNAILQVLEDVFASRADVVRFWKKDAVLGPRGGTSAQATFVIRVGDVLCPIAVNVYSDDKIRGKVNLLLEEEEELKAWEDRLKESGKKAKK